MEARLTPLLLYGLEGAILLLNSPWLATDSLFADILTEY